jgi:DNA-directed RNA polymerase subunit beta'
MAVHVPLSAEAQAEARILMLSSNNILSPADGRPITSPTQDMIIGLYSLTREDADGAGTGRIFSSIAEATMAFDQRQLGLQSIIKIRLEVAGVSTSSGQVDDSVSGVRTIETTLGRALFNETLPADYPFINYAVKKSQLGKIINDLAARYPKVTVAATLDALKDAGFRWATRSGVTISFADVVAPEAKKELLAAAEEKADKIQSQFERGLISDSERRQELIEIWTKTTDQVQDAMKANLEGTTNPVWMMVDSGARGNMLQIRQIAGMRGLVANPKGEIIPRPIKSNFREGLSVLEYFISTHGARKGLADTALRTADSGYLTRRLVDVSQDVIIREEDCGTDRGLTKDVVVNGKAVENLDTAIASRCLAEDVVVDGKKLYEAGQDLGVLDVAELVEAGVAEVKVRSVLTCESKVGVCARCYGRSLATNKLVDIGEAVGIIAAQSIGEPGTQLTMRTFHTGGAAAAGGDITHGLPRVVEIFEARTPKGEALIATTDGRIRINTDDDKKNIVTLVPNDGKEEITNEFGKRVKLLVEDGQEVKSGDLITAGKPDPKKLLAATTSRTVQQHLTDEVQEVYRSQGVSINDKHLEVIIRQMLKRVIVLEQNDTAFLEGALLDRATYEEANRETVLNSGKPAVARPELMGITKASLATESWLSAASFQETTRVLTDAAINAKRDPLLGLKENVIIGKLIPAGTGLPRYRNVRVEPTEEAKAAVYANMTYDNYAADFDNFGSGTGEAVRLEDYDLGQYR